MSLHVKLHYTHIDPSLVDMETCRSCKGVTESPGGDKHGGGKEGMDQSVWQNKATKSQPDSQGPAIPMPSQTCSQDCNLQEILGNVKEEAVT